MKLTSKLALFGVTATLGTMPVTSADEAAPEVATLPEETVIEEPIVIVDPVVEPTDEKPVVVEPPTDVEEVTGDVVVDDGGGVPIDWVKRDLDGGEGEGVSTDVIFYNMSGGGPQPTVAPESPIAKGDAGKDDTATATEAKTLAPVAPIAREKKGPIALVKGARVFLRH